jgi:hypothetical protein
MQGWEKYLPAVCRRIEDGCCRSIGGSIGSTVISRRYDASVGSPAYGTFIVVWIEAFRVNSCCTFIEAPVSSSHDQYVWQHVRQPSSQRPFPHRSDGPLGACGLSVQRFGCPTSQFHLPWLAPL